MQSRNFSLADLEDFCSRFYGGKRLTIVPYAYTATFLALAQNAQQTAMVQIAANADFFCIGIRHRAQIGAAQTASTKTAPFVRALIVDTGSNEQFTSAAIDLENYSSGGDGLDRTFPYPRVLSGRSALSVQLTNYAPTAETYTTIDLMFEGVLVRVVGN